MYNIVEYLDTYNSVENLFLHKLIITIYYINDIFGFYVVIVYIRFHKNLKFK